MDETNRNVDDSPPAFEEDPRYRVSVREAWVSVLYWLLFTVAMIAVAWGIGGDRDPARTTYILGFPDWFFWSGLVTAGVFSTVVPYLMVKHLFTDMPLETDEEPRS